MAVLAAGCAARRPKLDPHASFRVENASERSYTLAGPEADAAPVELGKLMERQYAYVAGRGYIDVLPGMRLSATRAYFGDGGKAELKNYLGTETGRWVWDPPRFRFAGSDATPGWTRPAGKPAIRTLVGTGRRKQRLYRLFFQIRWFVNGRDSQRGSVVIGAPDAAALEAASETLMKEQPVACGPRLDCIAFPALTTVTADVGVMVNGDQRWVPWGSTLRAIAPADTEAGVRVTRRHGAARPLPVQFDASDPQAWLFPLLPRDRVEWPPVPGGDGPPVVERVAMSGPNGTIPVAFDVRGSGKTALVLIHCWACDRTYWREQTREFSRDFTVVTLDLPGHGRLAAPGVPRLVLNQANQVAAVVKDLALERVILVGHSMGAHVALAAAARLREVVRGVVIVESMHDASVRPTAAMIDPIARQLEADFPKAIEAMVRTQFKPGVNGAAREWVIARARKADPAVAVGLLRDYVNVDAAALLAAAAGVPVHAINTGPTKTPGLAVTVVDNAGHFPQLERPAEFNAALRAVLAHWSR